MIGYAILETHVAGVSGGARAVCGGAVDIGCLLTVGPPVRLYCLLPVSVCNGILSEHSLVLPLCINLFVRGLPLVM